jgi:CheY-like chemotaxis protein
MAARGEVLRIASRRDRINQLFVRHSLHIAGEIAITNSISQTACESPAARATAVLPRHRILIVDDARASTLILTKLLEILGQEVCAVGNATEALERIHRELPDLVISDIGMPGFDGYQLARAIRDNPELNDIELVALTGYAEESDKRRAQEAGFNQHLVKPISLANLQSLLAARLQRLGGASVRAREIRPLKGRV